MTIYDNILEKTNSKAILFVSPIGVYFKPVKNIIGRPF
jgi:hypothetical protein